MKLTELSIQGVGGIKSLHVNFRPDMNIICGPNGIGKSTLLLAASFPFLHGVSQKIKRNISSETGIINLVIKDGDNSFISTANIQTHSPKEQVQRYNGDGFDKKKLIKFDTMRNFEYQYVSALNADKTLSVDEISQQINTGVNLYDIKEWFAKRDLFEYVKNG